jgi:hypothetical protein
VIDLLAASPEPAADLLRRTGLLADPNPALLDWLLSRAGGHAREPALSIERARELTLDLIVSLLLKLSEARSLVFAAEDLHWADPTTLELLARLARELAASSAAGGPAPRLLVILTARLEFALPGGIELPILELPRLTRDEVERMIATGLADRKVPDEVLRRIVSRSDGVPLFVEEITHVLSERGLPADPKRSQSELAPIRIPGSLLGLLTARLDSVSPRAHATAQLASVLGREFRFDLLHAVSPCAEALLRRDLGELLRAGLVFPRRSGGLERFVFKHGLVRDAAYESMLRSTRRRHHGHIAEVLIERMPHVAELQRRLAAILSADAVSYARLMAEDEPGTVRAVREHHVPGCAGSSKRGVGAWSTRRATICSPSSRASSRPCSAPSRSSGTSGLATSRCPNRAACVFASASISATCWSRASALRRRRQRRGSARRARRTRRRLSLRGGVRSRPHASGP